MTLLASRDENEPQSHYALYYQGRSRALAAGRAAEFEYPREIQLTGRMVDIQCRDFQRILAVAMQHHYTLNHYKGGVVVVRTPRIEDQWFITFNGPDEDHDEDWFYRATGSRFGYVVDAEDLDFLLEHLPAPVQVKLAPGN